MEVFGKGLLTLTEDEKRDLMAILALKTLQTEERK
jgi:hypothetical protein